MTDYNVDVTISVNENKEIDDIKRTIEDKLEHHVNSIDDVLVTKTEKLEGDSDE